MAKFKGLIEKPASKKKSLSIKIESDVADLHDEVHQLLKQTGSKLNLDKALQPMLRSILQDAKHQLVEVLDEQIPRQDEAKSKVNSSETTAVDLEPA